MNKPNILLVTCHDLGKRLGCYGVRGLTTPALDTLAREGVLFENAFSTAPLCSPSRGALLTGVHPHVNGLMGLVNRGWNLPGTYPTLPELFRRHGYTTTLFGLQHERKEPVEVGYDAHIHPQRPHTCETVSAEFDSWLRARGRADRPFFASVGFFETHRPFKDPRYKADDPASVDVPPYLPDAPEVREDLADLHGMVFAVDAAMDRILAALEETMAARNTLVIFTTDHGIAFPRAKATLYDPGIETALLMRWPAGFEKARRFPHLVSNVDLFPTILEAAGLPVPAHAEGRSLMPLLRGDNFEMRREVFAGKTWHDVYDPIRAIRTEKFKYIRNFPGDGGAAASSRPALSLPVDIEQSPSRKALAAKGDPHLAPRAEDELYDLTQDPHELNNVAHVRAYAPAVAELRARLLRWMEETNDPLLQGPVPCPDPAMQIR